MSTCPNCQATLQGLPLTCPSCGAEVPLWIRRGEEIYGPYRLADLYQAQAEGRLSAEDMVSAGDEGEWQPIQALLGGDMPTPQVPPPPPVPMSATAPRPAAGKQKNTTLLVVLIAVGFALFFVLPILAAVIFPVFAKSREKARQAACMSNLKMVSVAMLQYCADNDERFPSSYDHRPGDCVQRIAEKESLDIRRDFYPARWRRLFFPYAKNPELFVCPSSRYAYVFNDALYGKGIGEIGPPSELAAIYDAGWLMKWPAPPHNGGFNVGYADGHVQWRQKPVAPPRVPSWRREKP